jgi:TolB protein
MRRKLLIPLPLTLLLMALPSAAVSGTTDVAPPRTGLIAFERQDRQNEALYVMKADGSEQRKLADGCCFDWSPDGRKLAFVAETKGIYTINVDGTGLRLLTTRGSFPVFPDETPDWSPDGRRIVFADEGDGMFVIDREGGKLTRLTRGDDLGPRWSPNGRKILFQRLIGDGQDIFVVNTDGTGERRLTQGLESGYPAWSPGGSRIAYAFWGGGGQSIYVMNADGSDQHELVTTQFDRIHVDIVWSPRGARILFLKDRAIHTIRPDGRRHRKVAGGRNFNPKWSTDGRSIIFSRIQSHNRDIWVMDTRGKNQADLTNTPAPVNEQSPVWSP